MLFVGCPCAHPWSYATILPSNLMRTTYECVHNFVTTDHFRSHDKDGGYTIRFAISKKTHAITLKLRGSMFYWTGFIAYGSFELRYLDWISTFFTRSCNLDLNPMTFICELDPYSLEIYRTYNELLTSRLETLTNRQTDRQTDTTEIIYHAPSRVHRKRKVC